MRVIPDSDPPAIRRARRRRWAFLTLFAAFVILVLLGVVWAGTVLSRHNPVPTQGEDAARVAAAGHWLVDLSAEDVIRHVAGEVRPDQRATLLGPLRSPGQVFLFGEDDARVPQGWLLQFHRTRPIPWGMAPWRELLSRRATIREASASQLSAGRITNQRILLGQSFEELDPFLALLEGDPPPINETKGFAGMEPDAVLQFEGEARVLPSAWRAAVEHTIGAEFPHEQWIRCWWLEGDLDLAHLLIVDAKAEEFSPLMPNAEVTGPGNAFILLRLAPPLGEIVESNPMVEEIRWLPTTNAPALLD